MWYVYILEFTDGRHYVGETNDLKVRLSEHAMGAGVGTGRDAGPKLVWFNSTNDRAAARRMETRLRRAVEHRPDDVSSMIDQFQELIRLVIPERTYSDSQEESTSGETEARRPVHVDSGIAQSVDRGLRKGWRSRWRGLLKP